MDSFNYANIQIKCRGGIFLTNQKACIRNLLNTRENERKRTGWKKGEKERESLTNGKREREGGQRESQS